MKNCGYYSFPENTTRDINSCNRASDEEALLLNCAGRFSSAFPFTTENRGGRADFYLIYVAEGALSFATDEGSVLAEGGSFVLLPPSRPYSYTFAGAGELSYFWAHFTGRDAAHILSKLGIEPFPHLHHSFGGGRVARRFESIFDAYANTDRHRELDLSALLLRLLVTLARSAEEKREGSLRASLRHISAFYATDIAISDLAKMENLSVSRFHALFKEQTGQAPGQYILGLRMASAKDLLTATDLSVKQIGILCGYTDPHFFSKIFKKAVGVSPTDFREGK